MKELGDLMKMEIIPCAVQLPNDAKVNEVDVNEAEVGFESMYSLSSSYS